jgi:hypothetical protein
VPKDFFLTSPVPVGGRASHDHYPTPRWCVLALLAQGAPLSETSVLDPSCGEGSILDVFREMGCETVGIEMDKQRALAAEDRGHRVEVDDALACPWPKAGWLVGNPPYTLAGEFAGKAAEWAEREGGRAALLLRLSFLEPASGRGALFKRHRPDVFVLPRRPAFIGRGTDNITSAWFCWPGTGQLDWLPP